MKIWFLRESDGEARRKEGAYGVITVPGARWQGRTGGSQLVAAVVAFACLTGLAGCGEPANADGDWSGRIEFGEEDGREAAMDLSLSLYEAEDGVVAGSGMLAVEADGERKEMELGEVSGRVSEDGELALTGSSGEFLSGIGVELRGELGSGSMNGEATVGADDLLPDVLAGTDLLAGSESLSGDFALQRESE